MYKYVIVEDELYARLGIEQKVKATGLPFELAGVADNGPDAFHLIMALEPDCVITDMEIPLYDGSELLDRLHQAHARAKIIIVSGYTRFQYARSGIDAGALAYLLKPISVQEMQDALQRVLQAIHADAVAGEKEPHQAQDELSRIRDLLDGKGDANAPFATLNIDVDGSYAAVAAAETPLQDRAGFDELINIDLPQGGVVIAAFGGSDSVADVLASRLAARPGRSGVSHACQGLSDLAACARQARLARLRIPMWAQDGCAAYEPTAPDRQSLLKMFAALALPAALQGDRQELMRLLKDEWRDLAISGGAQADVMICVWNLQALAATATRRHFASQEAWRALEDASLNDGADVVAKYVDLALADVQPSESYEPFTSMVCRFVQEHYAEPLSLELAAARFNVSPSHLSRSLAAEYGAPFNRLLNTARMRHARRLLVDTDMPLAAVAGKCGFNGEKYFMQVFRQRHGTTPGEWRVVMRRHMEAYDRKHGK